jgi:hypothetical protein
MENIDKVILIEPIFGEEASVGSVFVYNDKTGRFEYTSNETTITESSEDISKINITLSKNFVIDNLNKYFTIPPEENPDTVDDKYKYTVDDLIEENKAALSELRGLLYDIFDKIREVEEDIQRLEDYKQSSK